MKTLRLRRPKFIPLITTFLAVTVMFSLGVWQLQRLVWKEHLLALLEQSRILPALTQLPADAQLPAHEFRKVELPGRYLHHKEFHLGGRYHNGRLGYGIVTPLQLDDGRIILVNRGWVPLEKKLGESRPETLQRGRVTVDGMLRVSGLQRRFAPAADIKDNLWFSLDPQKMGAAAGLILVSAVIERIGQGHAYILPIPSLGIASLRNDHLGYALTWFAVALSCFAIFILYHRENHHG